METIHRHSGPDGAAPLGNDEAASAFAALGSAVRLDILRALVRAGDKGLPVGTLQERMGLPASTLSHHVKALVGAGVIAQERDGRNLICTARFDRVERLADFLVRECCADVSGAAPVEREKEGAE